MPRLTKVRKAAKAREVAKKLVRETAKASLQNSSAQLAAGAGPWFKTSPEDDDGPIPPGPTGDIQVKQELLDLVVNPFAAAEQLEPEIKVEVEVELTEPEESDPIGQQQIEECKALLLDDLPAITLADPDAEITCQFCLKQFRETIGRGVITRNRIAFVLGVRKWDTSHEQLDCCKDCKKMFDLFHDFKRSCLMALARPLFLMSCPEEKVSTAVIDLRPKKFRKRKRRPQIRNVEVKRDPEIELPRSESPSVVPLSPIGNSDVEVVDEANLNEPDELDGGSNTEQSSSDEMAPNEGEENATNQPKTKKRKERKYCYRCKKFYATEAIYWEHKPTCTKPAREPAYECSICSKRFPTSLMLMYHLNRHNGVRTVPCRREGCTKMFFDSKHRHNHEQHCGQEVQVICSVCGAIFRSKGALRAHMPSHGEPTVVCEVCNKAFHTRAKLKKHMSVHSDARNFECKVCGKRFKSHEANRVHQRIHTQEKPYICHICGMAFTYNCLLKTHLEKGHEVVDPNQKELLEASRALAWPSGGY